jgi:hypothetical protein
MEEITIKNWDRVIVFWTPNIKASQIASCYWLWGYKNLLLVNWMDECRWINLTKEICLFKQAEYPKIKIVDNGKVIITIL